MTGWRTLTRTTRLVLAVLFGTVGCQTLIGVEERHLGAEPVCLEYCDSVMAACQGNAVYASREQCLGVCRLLDKGDPADTKPANTVACRTRQAQGAGLEPSVACDLAGPGGGSECGSDCKSYCQIFRGACKTQTQGLTQEECERQCSALRQSNGFGITDTFQQGDSLACRLNQAVAATVNPGDHCAHATIASIKPSEPCTDPAGVEASCDDYCRIVPIACSGDDQVYENEAQCRAVCDAIPHGTNGDSGGVTDASTEVNSIGCRKYHAYSALATSASVHCPHAGPTGDGYCGNELEAICESYCLVVHKTCKTAYEAAFPNDDANNDACRTACKTLGGATEDSAEEDDLRYSVRIGEKGGPTVPCRMLHAVRASTSTNPEVECAAALGQTDCN